MNFTNKITALLGVDYPIIQAGMVWCSGWRLASAVSNAGGLGVVGSGSMHPDTLKQHIFRCRSATDKPFAINVPLMNPDIQAHMRMIMDLGVKIVITSAGNPGDWTSVLKKNNVKVIHVVSNVKYAEKSEAAGVDAVVAEGVEAGGHNGREETTTLCLVPLVKKAVSVPVIAAGGIASGRAMRAVMVLGADGVQIGSRFAASLESSAHSAFKKKIIAAADGDTMLALKKVIPVRLLKNEFYDNIHAMEENGASAEELTQVLGTGRTKRGIFEGDILAGELKIGQVSALIDRIEPAKDILLNIWNEYLDSYNI